jgi:hypothetical protein
LNETLNNIVKANGKDITNPDIKKQIEARVNKLVKECDADGMCHWNNDSFLYSNYSFQGMAI